MCGETPDFSKAPRLDARHSLIYPSKIPSWLCHASLDSAVNRPNSKAERVQRRATKYILDLPFICDQIIGTG